MNKDKSKSRRKKKEKKLSNKELRELMGEFQPTYCRRNGAIRRK